MNPRPNDSELMPSNLRQAIAEVYLADENTVSAERIALARFSPAENAATEALAREFATRIRAEGTKRGGVDAFTQEYSLSTEEGVALMCLAEALLRVPDADTADRLIRDKIGSGNWDSHDRKSDSVFVNASTWALMLTGRIVRMDQTAGWDFEGIIKKVVARSGEPVIRQAIMAAMRMLGGQFVLGRTMSEALKNSRTSREQGYRFSFDMLGEAAYTAGDAERHMGDYFKAIDAIAVAYPAGQGSIFERPSISVKLSAVHPRYERLKRERVMAELKPALSDLIRHARASDIAVTIDAEEADRHEIMLDLFEQIVSSDDLKGWSGFGLVVQAYQKRAVPSLSWLIALARRLDRRIPVRLVKGAYWDTEIKRAQEAGLYGLSRVHAQSGDRYVVYRLCARHAGGARRHLSAIRYA